MTAVTSTREVTLAAIESSGVVAVVRLPDATALSDVADALLSGGVCAIEVTMTVPRAVEIIAELAAAASSSTVIGAGTVADAETAARVIDAGARFVVSPIFDAATVAYCRRRDVAVMPGCFTPTEIHAAFHAGADVVKVFPATSLGPTFFKDIRGPFPAFKLMPTGGVTAANAAAWIAAGAYAVGAGSALVDPAAVARRDFAAIAANARAFVDAVRDARQKGGR